LINKLQNSIILLVFQILKMWNIRFVRNIVLSSSCEFYDDDFTVTCDVTYKHLIRRRCHWNPPIKNSGHYGIFVDKKINAYQIHSKTHPVYGNKCFTKQTVHVLCKKILGWQKFVSYTQMQSIVLQWRWQHRFFASSIPNFADR